MSDLQTYFDSKPLEKLVPFDGAPAFAITHREKIPANAISITPRLEEEVTVKIAGVAKRLRVGRISKANGNLYEVFLMGPV